MGEVIKLLAICATVAVCLTSCIWGANESNRINYEAKQSCFDAGGAWNYWQSFCERPTP